MIRMPRVSGRRSPAEALSCRGGLGAAALLLLALLAASCGQDNQRVPEDFPSGAKPAPIPAADLAAGQAELPPAPPAEPAVEPPAEQAPPGNHAAVEARPGTGAAPGRLRLSGTYQADAAAAVTCVFLAGRGLQLTIDSAPAPAVEVIVTDFLGAGHYVAEARLRTRGAAAAAHSPAGEVQLDIQVSEIDRPHVRGLLSGTFDGAYAGPSGIQGRLSGTFDRCLYGGALP